MLKFERFFFHFVVMFLLCFSLETSAALKKKKPEKSEAPVFEQQLFNGMRYRNIGPFRGGRSAAVASVTGAERLFYFGSTGGGVWKTEDGGGSWENISDGFFGGSIGAVAVSEADPNVIYVGGGEKTVRGNVSSGHGMWKSLDAGKTWKAIGLKDSRHISRIRVHPKNPELVYVAVMGHLSGPNDERGVYRSRDGGQTWERLLFVNREAGAVDLIMDPNNARVLYASTWRFIRKPYALESGGEGSALWKSTDGGDHWENISDHEGLPKGTWGINGICVSPANSERLWAIVEADKGGVFRSDDGGETWNKVNDERKLRQRAWYYTRIYADPVDEDTVYVLNVRFWKSKDGGRTYSSISTPHGDHHDLWIDGKDPKRMIVGDDGGAQVSFDGGDNWSTYHNQPTAQFYRVTTDNDFPYRIYGAQQDNSTVRIRHRVNGFAIGEDDWEPTAGGESGHIAPHPENPDIVYGGSYGGYLTRVNHDTGQSRLVDVWPDNPMGHGAKDMKYRFQWNFPILFSPHDPNTLYAAANVLFKTTNEGQSWQAISPDLTRNDPSTMGPSGGPITKDNTSVEYYGTIFAVAESTHEAGVIWTGSDDGLVQVTRDGGANWVNVTPKGMPEWMQINSIEIDPFNKGGLYFAGTRYKSDDFNPYLYHTNDYGQTWRKIVEGIDKNHFTRVIRADPKRQGLLYAGTESGMYVSFNDGERWQSFQMNLPIVPITDLALKNDDLIVATQGRSFWVMDDVTPLHHLTDQIAKADLFLYPPKPAYRLRGARQGGEAPGGYGENAPGGVLVHYFLKALPEKEKGEKEGAPEDSAAAKKESKSGTVKLEFLEPDGDVIATFQSDSKKRDEKLEPKAGLNRFIWDLQYPDAEDFPGMILWGGSVRGPEAPPGEYLVRLTVGEATQTQTVQLLGDPRAEASDADYQAQFEFLISVRDKLSEAHKAIQKIRKIRKSVETVTKPLKGKEDYKDVVEAGKALEETVTAIEEALYQTKNQSRQDPLNFPIRLNNKLAAVGSLASRGNYKPTAQMISVRDEVTAAIDEELAKFGQVLEKDVPEFNKLVAEKQIPAIWLEESVD